MARSQREQLIVRSPLETEFECVDRIVTAIAQQLGESRRTVLIDEELHPAGCIGVSVSPQDPRSWRLWVVGAEHAGSD